MTKIALSDVGLKSLQAPARGQFAVWDKTLPGFGCRISQGGAKTFILKRRNSLITVGRYPIITLAEARTVAKRLLAEFTLGKNAPQPIAYQEATERFIEEKAKSRRPTTVASYASLLKSMNFNCKIAEISHDDTHRMLARFKSPGSYNHHLVTLRVFFNWCIKRRYRLDNPTLGLSSYKRPRRARVLSNSELKAVWFACDNSELAPNFCIIVKLLILMGQRRGETAALKAKFYSSNGQTLCLPAALTKNGREHTFPIGPLSIALITACPAITNNDREALLLAVDGTSEPFSAWSKNKKLLDKLSGVQKWTLHDLRRTFRTNLGALGIAPHVAERLVNHASARGEMEEVYDLHSYLPEMRDAMDRWEIKLSSILSEPKLQACA